MAYKTEFQSNNADLQSILDTIKAWKSIPSENPSNFIPTDSGKTNYKSKIKDNNTDLLKLLYRVKLIDFEYIENEDGTFLLAGWKETYNGIPSNDLIIPIDSKIIL